MEADLSVLHIKSAHAALKKVYRRPGTSYPVATSAGAVCIKVIELTILLSMNGGIRLKDTPEISRMAEALKCLFESL